jgi:hypothetical protein
MRHVLLPLLVLLPAGLASAAPVKVDETPGITWYVETASIVTQGNVRRVSVVQDYASPDPRGVRSRLVTYEVHCLAERLRSVSVSEHAEPMAQGSPVATSATEWEWRYLAPQTGTNIARRSPYRSIARLVCPG